MFRQIFLFEINYRLRRPGIYMYFFLTMLFTLIAFANGDVPSIEKEFINAPAVLAIFSSTASVFFMMVSSAVMGVPLYRDIEYNTKEYYLSYPITKAGYFWGRYLGSFVFVVLIGASIYPGIYLGGKLGVAMGWIPASRIGADHFYHYLYPFLTLVVPSLFFTSSLFFSLVAVFKNVKVIYSSGLFLFLGYIISNFFLHNINNPKVIFLADPFLVNGMQSALARYPVERLNAAVIPMDSLMILNRIIWVGVGGIVLLAVYGRFSFNSFFEGQTGRTKKKRTVAAEVPSRIGIRAVFRQVNVKLEGSYFRKTLFSLTKIEILNIVRDNYFWIILFGCLTFLSFIFWHGPNPYGVGDYPRAAFFMDAFSNDLSFFIFFLIIFYTGETVHRERLTRYAFINDALPPPTWVLNCAKLLSLCCLAAFLSGIPIYIGVGVQLLKGYHSFNFPLYFSSYFVSTLPRLLEMVLFCYALHILVRNKFAAHGIGITLWAFMGIASNFHYFNYNLLLFGFTPFGAWSDMDGIGHMLRPILWYNGYWLLAGSLMVVLGSLFYSRGVSASFKEVRRLAAERFRGITRAGSIVLFAALLAVGGYIYYNVSYLNEYRTAWERDENAAIEERGLKKYEKLPLPKVTRMRMEVELYPAEQEERTRAFVTIMNKGGGAIDSLLLDGDNLTEYTLRYNGSMLSYSVPLELPSGKFSVFKPRKEPSDYRLYRLPSPLMPGDSAVVEVNSLVSFPGFGNDLYGANLLHNGIFFNGGLPGLGYDGDEELVRSDTRQEHGLAVKTFTDIQPDDPVGRRTPQSRVLADLVSLDITVGTSSDQVAIAPGVPDKEWRAGGRHYFHYVQDRPKVYMPFGIASARYNVLRDTVLLASGPVNLEIYYSPEHARNLSRFMTVYKDGLRYFSRAFGPYPFRQLRLVESSGYGPYMATFANTDVYSERFGWNADMRNPDAFDYIYFVAAEHLAHEWWGQQVIANHTVGARVVTDGLSKYAALMLMQYKYGVKGLNRALNNEGWDYRNGRHRTFFKENDLLHANEGWQWYSKAGIVLNGLRVMMGEDSLNAALREFGKQFAFRNGGEYAGGYDLYDVLKKHVPDSLQYYLRDSWEKVCMYDNRVVDVTTTALGNDQYKVRMTLELNKLYFDSAGNERPAGNMNDLVAIGISGGKGFQRMIRLKAGRQVIEWLVQGKPETVTIDPDGLLIDRNPDDNRMNVNK